MVLGIIKISDIKTKKLNKPITFLAKSSVSLRKSISEQNEKILTQLSR